MTGNSRTAIHHVAVQEKRGKQNEKPKDLDTDSNTLMDDCIRCCHQVQKDQTGTMFEFLNTLKHLFGNKSKSMISMSIYHWDLILTTSVIVNIVIKSVQRVSICRELFCRELHALK